MLQRLNAIIITLQQLEIKSTEENMDRLLGCIQELKRIHKELEEQKTQITETYGGGKDA